MLNMIIYEDLYDSYLIDLIAILFFSFLTSLYFNYFILYFNIIYNLVFLELLNIWNSSLSQL